MSVGLHVLFFKSKLGAPIVGHNNLPTFGVRICLDVIVVAIPGNDDYCGGRVNLLSIM